MFERGYRQQLEADLVKWVAAGVISGDAAQSIRKARFSDEAKSRLPGIFAMLGALMLAASVSPPSVSGSFSPNTRARSGLSLIHI